jgi:hypothetical protein
MRIVILSCALFVFAVAAPAQARVYSGPPDLALTSVIVHSGGGAAQFDSVKLLAALAGPALPAELASLRRRYGSAAVADFAPTFTFAIDSALRAATKAGVTLPPPATMSRPQLVAALWNAGRSEGNWDVGIFLDRLISHPIHHVVMRDIDASPRFGPAKNASFYIVLTQAMHDLATANHLI